MRFSPSDEVNSVTVAEYDVDEHAFRSMSV